MLNFLRKLRRNNMNSKYLKYATGEIVLVVLGILIALSINNWNERLKDRAYEVRMLSELKVALDDDIAVFSRFEKLIKEWRKSVLYLTDAVNSSDPQNLNRDSILYHVDVLDGFGVYALSNTGPYESIKSSGLDKISNDVLRNKIAKFYGSDLASFDIWINEIIRQTITEKFQLFEQLFDRKVMRIDDLIESELIIEDLSFLKDPDFTEILIKSHQIIDNTIPPFQSNRKTMEDLSEMIKNEIQ